MLMMPQRAAVVHHSLVTTRTHSLRRHRCTMAAARRLAATLAPMCPSRRLGITSTILLVRISPLPPLAFSRRCLLSHGCRQPCLSSHTYSPACHLTLTALPVISH